MIRFFVVTIVAIVFGSFLAVFIKNNPGTLYVVLSDKTLQLTLWMGILLLVLFITTIFVAVWLIQSLLRSKRQITSWGNQRGQRRARQQTHAGLVSLTEGHWQKAEQLFVKSSQKSDSQLINYLLAARAAQEQKNFKQRDHYLQEASLQDPDAGLAIGVTQAELQYESGQYELSLATVTQLKTEAPKHPYLLKLLAKNYYRLKDWKNLYPLLPQLKKHHTFDKDIFESLKEQCLQQLLLSEASKGSELFINFWQQLSDEYRKHTSIVLYYARLLIELGETQIAEASLRAQLKRGFNADLIFWYAFSEHKDVTAQLNFAETFVKDAGNNPALLFCLGKLCFKAELWGKAKTYLNQSINLAGPAETYDLLAATLQQLGESSEVVIDRLKQGLHQAHNEVRKPLLSDNMSLSSTNQELAEASLRLPSIRTAQ